jgi:hypothetical protein
VTWPETSSPTFAGSAPGGGVGEPARGDGFWGQERAGPQELDGGLVNLAELRGGHAHNRGQGCAVRGRDADAHDLGDLGIEGTKVLPGGEAGFGQHADRLRHGQRQVANALGDLVGLPAGERRDCSISRLTDSGRENTSTSTGMATPAQAGLREVMSTCPPPSRST